MSGIIILEGQAVKQRLIFQVVLCEEVIGRDQGMPAVFPVDTMDEQRNERNSDTIEMQHVNSKMRSQFRKAK